MQRRFFIDSPVSTDTVVLTGPDAHHVANVIRLKPGESITLFDGSGREFDAVLKEIKKKEVIAEVQSAEFVSRELPSSLTICSALPKGDRQKVLLEKLVELGVTTFVPLNCARSVVVSKDKTTDKMGRWVVESSKQCGRNSLMRIEKPVSFQKLVAASTTGTPIVVHPYDSETEASQFASHLEAETATTIAIGPEGGFSDEEIEWAKSNGWHIVGLGKSILRTETAAVVAATIFGIGRG